MNKELIEEKKSEVEGKPKQRKGKKLEEDNTESEDKSEKDSQNPIEGKDKT